MKPRWHYVEYLLARAALGLVDTLPSAGGLWLADLASRLTYSISRRRCGLTRENIRRAGVANNPADVERLTFLSLQSFVRTITETALLRNRLRPDNWGDHVEITPDPAVADLIRNPRQALIIASAHQGNWEVAARAFSMIRPVSVIYRPFRNPHLDRYFTGERGNDRLRLISKFDLAPRRLLDALDNGGILALMMDQRMPAKSSRLQIDFFGRPAWTTRAIAMLHLTTRAPVVVACAVRTGHLKFNLRITGPVPAQRTGNRDSDIRQLMEGVVAEIERHIRARPEQYMWGNRCWLEAGSAVPSAGPSNRPAGECSGA